MTTIKVHKKTTRLKQITPFFEMHESNNEFDNNFLRVYKETNKKCILIFFLNSYILDSGFAYHAIHD